MLRIRSFKVASDYWNDRAMHSNERAREQAAVSRGDEPQLAGEWQQTATILLYGNELPPAEQAKYNVSPDDELELEVNAEVTKDYVAADDVVKDLRTDRIFELDTSSVFYRLVEQKVKDDVRSQGPPDEVFEPDW